jgi:hypothetical protein
VVRTIALLLIGIVAGALAGYQYARPDPAVPVYGTDGEPVDASATVVSEDEVDPLVAVDDEIGTLVAELDRVAATRASPLRDRALADQLVLVGRADAVLAVERAMALGLEPKLLAEALARLALVDGEGAIDLLGVIADPLSRREAAVAVARALGADAEALSRVLAGLPDGVGATVVRTDFYAAIAAVEPDRALTLALAEVELGPRTDALRHVAAIWATRAPREALARIGRIPDPGLAEQFERTVMNVWARADPAGALARLDEARFDRGGALKPEDMNVLEWATQGDPEIAFAWALTRPEGLRRGLVQSVLVDWARRDPAAALAAWASVLDEAGRSARDEAIVAVLAELDDVDVAIDALMRIDDPLLRQEGLRQLARRGRSWSDARRLAERLLASDEAGARDALGSILVDWSLRDPAGALDWYEATPAAPDGTWVARAAGVIAVRDPGRAERLLQARDPAEQQRFLATMLGTMSGVNYEAALAALDRWRDFPGHGEAVLQMAFNTARAQPEVAVALVDRYDAWDVDGRVARGIARGWIPRSPIDAINWAQTLDADQGRDAAVEAAFELFSQIRRRQARLWAARQPAGPERDSFFARLYVVGAERGDVDPTLLAQIEDDEIRAAAERTP